MKTARPLALAAAALAIGVGAYVGVQTLGGPQPAPPVTYTLLDGTPSGIEALRGKVVLVNFWATTCVTCVREMPQIVATHEKFKGRGFDTVAVAMNWDSPAHVVRFAQSRQLPFPVAIDDTGEIARRFGDVSLTPTTVVINKRGEIVKRFVGEPDFPQLHRLVEKLLAEA